MYKVKHINVIRLSEHWFTLCRSINEIMCVWLIINLQNMNVCIIIDDVGILCMEV